MRRALANSLNIPAVKTLALVGLPEALKTAEDMGITTLNTPDRYGLSLVLGGGEVKPIEMAGAFAAFGDNGTFHQPTTILKVQDNKGKTLSEYKPEENSFQALDPQIAYEISNILDDDDARCMVFGCDNPLNFGDVHVAAKTGTTQEFHDAWTNGYTTKIATSVWVGNNDNTKMTNGADGIVVAAPIFHDYMANFATEDDFIRPSGIQDLSVEKYSSKLPTQYSKEYTKDIFASWQVPTERDDINVVLKVNKINGRLATDNTPLELIEERLFTNLHNEWGKLWKDYPNWEGPVRGWAIGHGMNLAPPSEDDDSYNGRPSISFSNPISGATLTGEVALRVSVGSDQKIDNVTYYLGDTQIASSTGAPYAASFNSSSYPNGAYKLTAKVTDVNGVSEQNSIDVTLQNESAPRISNLSVSGITTNTATISFLTDISSSTKVDFGLSAGNLDQSKQINSSSTSHSTIISGLSSGKKYYFRVTATNSKGTSSSAEGNFTTL